MRVRTMADPGPPPAFIRGAYPKAAARKAGRPANGANPLAVVSDAYKVKPRNTSNMRPIAQAIQIALFRTDRGDNIPRIHKIAERLVREAVEGNNEALNYIRDMYEGKVVREQGEGEPVESLGSIAIVELLKHLIDQKRNSATLEVRSGDGVKPVTDVVVVKEE